MPSWTSCFEGIGGTGRYREGQVKQRRDWDEHGGMEVLAARRHEMKEELSFHLQSDQIVSPAASFALSALL
jgi:hypothetical protein